MRRTEHLGARALTAVGLAATLTYLVWRVLFSMHDTDLWLSIPVLAVEVVSFLGATVLAWALWPTPARRSAQDTTAAAAAPTHRVDVVLRVDQQAEHEVRASVLAIRSMERVDQLIIVDLSARPNVAGLATEFHAVYAASDPDDRNGLRVMVGTVDTPHFVLIDAGDIPTRDLVARLSPDLVDPCVAVVQGLGVSFAEDSAEHGPTRRHELVFERSALNPALGRRGCAMWTGSGSMVRTAALRLLRLDGEPSLAAQWQASTDLLAGGCGITAPGDVAVLAHRTLHSEQVVYEDRVQRARAARKLVFGVRGVLRSRAFTPSQRVSVLAWSVRPLSGLRRAVFITLICAALMAGSPPFHASAVVLALVWLPAFCYTSLGLALLSGWTMRPGDRARWSLLSIGPACSSLRGQPPARSNGRPPMVALPATQFGVGLVGAVAALSLILVLRGLSDRVTHTLGVMPQASLMGLLIVSLWTLGLSLDLLRVLARRAQMRSTARVISSFSATLGERAVSIADLTARGAGLISQTGVEMGERMLLDSAIPTSTGVTTMRVACVVRNVSMRADGEWRIGVEFGDVDDAIANALAEFCTIEPMWERLGVMPGRSVTEARQIMYFEEPEEEATGRMLVRLVSLLAIVGAVASSAPTSVEASSASAHRLAGVVVFVPAVDATAVDATSDPGPGSDEPPIDSSVADSLVDTDESVVVTVVADTTAPEVESASPEGVEGAVVVGVCSLDAGEDGAWGTADDVYGAPVATVTAIDGSYVLDLVGDACWASVAPPDEFEATSPSVPQPVDVSDSQAPQRTVVQRVDEPADAVAPSNASVGDTVWRDMNGNGVQDGGEPGVAGVMLTLYDTTGRSVATASSDARGGFRFEHLPAGMYSVGAANLPAGFVFTKPARGEDRSLDSDTDTVTGRSPLVPLENGQTSRGLDVGLVSRSAAAAMVVQTDARSTDAPVQQLLPAPDGDQLAAPGISRSTLSLLVLALAGLLAVSILLGLARPRSAEIR